MRYLILHISSPDQRGIIAQFTGILYDHGVNVLNLEQHVEPDDKLFFMRIVAESSDNSFNLSSLKNKLKDIDNELDFLMAEVLMKKQVEEGYE